MRVVSRIWSKLNFYNIILSYNYADVKEVNDSITYTRHFRIVYNQTSTGNNIFNINPFRLTLRLRYELNQVNYCLLIFFAMYHLKKQTLHYIPRMRKWVEEEAGRNTAIPWSGSIHGGGWYLGRTRLELAFWNSTSI